MKRDRLLIYGAAFAIMGLSNAVIPILPELASSHNIEFGGFASSLLFSAYFLGALATLLPFGILADRFGNLRFVGFGVVMTVISGLTILLSENLWILLVSRLIEGLACGAFFPAAFATLSKSNYPRRYTGEFTFLFSAGLAAGALLSGLLADIYLKGAILIFTLISFLLSLLLLLNRRELINPPGIEKSGMLPNSFGNLFRESCKELVELLRCNKSGIWLSSFLLNGAIGVLIAYFPEYSLSTLTKFQLGGSIASLYISAMIASLLAGHFRAKKKKQSESESYFLYLEPLQLLSTLFLDSQVLEEGPDLQLWVMFWLLPE